MERNHERVSVKVSVVWSLPVNANSERFVFHWTTQFVLDGLLGWTRVFEAQMFFVFSETAAVVQSLLGCLLLSLSTLDGLGLVETSTRVTCQPTWFS